MASKNVKKPVTKRKAAKARPATHAKSKAAGKAVVQKITPHQKKESAAFVIQVLDIKGGKSGSIVLPEDVFGVKVKLELLSQAVRVYLANQRQGNASTKTRGEVEGSTRKLFRQKGTGRARHGSIRAPIYVGGGIVFGPKPIDYRLAIPKKMKKNALKMALSAQYKDGNIIVVDGLGKLEPKTKQVQATLTAVGATGKTLLIVPSDAKNIMLGARNLAQVDIMPVANLNTYSVLTHGKILFTKDTIPTLKTMLISGE